MNIISLISHLNFNGEFLYNGRKALPIADPTYGRLYSKRVKINSETVLFPKQVVDISELHKIKYHVDHSIYHSYSDNSPIINWTLYADQMQPKSGVVEFHELNNL